MLKFMHVLVATAFLLFPLWVQADPPAGATVTPRVPDLPPPDGCACADSALANVIKYFSENGYPKLGQDANGVKLSDIDLVKAVNEKSPGSDVPNAAREYIKSKSYQDTLLIDDRLPTTFAAIVAELKKGQLVLLNLQVGNSPVLHTVTVVGWSDAGGVQQIGIHDINAPNAASTDYTGSTPDGTDFYKVHPAAVGSGFRFNYDGPRTFNTVSIVAISPKPPKKDGQPTSKIAKSTGKSVNFDAATSGLTFSNDFISATGFAGDALLGARVSPPPLELISTDPFDRTALFRPAGDERFTLRIGDQVVAQASLGQMRYDGSNNTLVTDLFDIALAGAPVGSPLFDAALAPFSSPWLDHIGAILDPGSAAFQDDTVLHLSYHPFGDLWDMTNAFTASAEAAISNFVYTQLVVPEPPGLPLVLTGIVLLCILRRTPAPLRLKRRLAALPGARATSAIV